MNSTWGCARTRARTLASKLAIVASMARGGYSIAIGHVDPEDNPQYFLEDAITASFGLANPLLSQLMCEESIPRTVELDAWGLGLAKQADGRLDQRESSRPHRYARLVHCGI